MMFKILAVISLLSIIGSGVAGYKAGGDRVRSQMSKAIEMERKSQYEKIENLITLNKAKKVIYRDKIKVIKSTVDATGCTDTIIPGDILSKLR